MYFDDTADWCVETVEYARLRSLCKVGAKVRKHTTRDKLVVAPGAQLALASGAASAHRSVA